MIRTRIAPSPTGYPHIGTIYQGLFDYVFARKYNGQFLIRIEDTDRTRYVEDAEDKIFAAFDWFNISEDESPRKPGPHSPYRQSERLELYQKYATELINKGHAYYCFCTKERLDEVRAKMQAEKKIPMYDKHCRNLSPEEIASKLAEKIPSVIRMKIPTDKKIIVHDGIRGDITFDSNGIDDQVIIKSDGFPTYHLAVVVDDHLMEISHVLRGEEWLSSAPKHFLLYEYFGWEKPQFFHTPLIRNPDKSKLSKRQGHTAVTWYQENGYLPEAILNYLALMGWTHPEEKEIFTREEFISLFEFKDLKPLGPIFDLKKLEWMNGDYIRNMSDDRLFDRIMQFYNNKLSAELVQKTIPLVKERIKKLTDYLPMCEFLMKTPENYEVDLSEKKEIISAIAEKAEGITDWQAQAIGEAMVSCAQELGVKNSEFFMILRVAISGRKITPPLNDSMEILGKDECVKRLQKAAQ